MQTLTTRRAVHQGSRVVALAVAAALFGVLASASAHSFDAPNIEVDEGDYASFKVTLSRAVNIDIRWEFETQDGTATSPGDYTATTGHLQISAGNTVGEVTVLTASDGVADDVETFNLRLFNFQVEGRDGWSSSGGMRGIPKDKTITATIREDN